MNYVRGSLFSSKHCSGVTLVELIVVLVIVGIMAGLAGILVGKRSDTLEIKTFTKEISSVLRYARNKAVSEKKQYCFVIDKNDDMYRLYTDKGADEETQEGVAVITEPIPEEMHVTLQDNEDESPFIEFFPQGNSSGGVLEITGEKGAAYLIKVNRLTGKLDVVKAE